MKLKLLYENMAYRGGPSSNMPKNMSAFDIVQYEQKELGNNINTELSDDELKNIPATQLMWVGLTPESVEEYGNVEPIEGQYVIVATDPDGGMLIKLLKDKSFKSDNISNNIPDISPEFGKINKKQNLNQRPNKSEVLWTSSSGASTPFSPKIAKFMGVANTTPMY